jgi:hypothetical protein
MGTEKSQDIYVLPDFSTTQANLNIYDTSLQGKMSEQFYHDHKSSLPRIIQRSPQKSLCR